MKDHDAEGLVDKYLVFKTRGEGDPEVELAITRADGRVVPDEAWIKQTWCFVLSPEKRDRYGFASRAALVAYSAAIEKVNPQLAKDILKKLHEIMNDIDDDTPEITIGEE